MHSISSDSQIAFVQFGDFRAADRSIRSGNGETYHSQKYSMDVVNRLAAQCRAVCVISVDSSEPHDEILASSVRSIGLPDIWQNGMGPLLQALNTFEPTHVVLRFPSLEVLKWAEDKSISVLVTLADSFKLASALVV